MDRTQGHPEAQQKMLALGDENEPPGGKRNDKREIGVVGKGKLDRKSVV
jgi:hypothetical protein